MRPLTTDELRDKGMVPAEQVGRSLRHPQLNLAQILLMVYCQWRVRGQPGSEAPDIA